jgi:hypothetical protein
MVAHLHDAQPRGPWVRALKVVTHEIREVIPPTLFFFVGFNVVLLTKRLMLSQYLIAYAGFGIATTSALIVGKVVLVADKMPLLRCFDRAPLAYPILYKTLVYTVLVLIARLLEGLVEFIADGGVPGSGRYLAEVMDSFSWSRFIAVQLWVFVLFLIYVAAHELNTLFGDGELFRILFLRRSTNVKSVRRARIRLLTRLNNLTNAHSLAELEDPASSVHRELVEILRALGAHGATAHPAKIGT